MQQFLQAYQSSFIQYYVFGNGAKTLFCLHGYGESGTSFQFLEQLIGDDYTLLAIDFPIHGNTQWNEKEAFTTDDLFAIIRMIVNDDDKKISLLAYSMGGRAALDLLEKFPDNFECTGLVAPDGLHLNIWYWITTQTWLGNRIFDFTMRNPGWFFTMVNIAGKIGLLNKSVIKFVHYYLDDKEQRMLLYKRWTCMRRVRPNLHEIKNICGEKNIRLNFLFGEYDRIILSKRARVFQGAKNISVHIIEAGHQLLREKHANDIIALLNR
jgi:pimeloyl-ACP methyl ester carboxylesterase